MACPARSNGTPRFPIRHGRPLGFSFTLDIINPDSETLPLAPLDEVIAACREAADQFPGVANYQFAPGLPESDRAKLAELGAAIAVKLAAPDSGGRVEEDRRLLAKQLLGAVEAKAFGE